MRHSPSTRSLLLLLVLAACAPDRGEDRAGPGSDGAGPGRRAAAMVPDNPIVRENRRPGTTDWQVPLDRLAVREIELFAAQTSVNRGGRLRLKVSLPASGTYDLDIYRLGSYGGAGGRLVHSRRGLRGVRQPACVDPYGDGSRLIECPWSTSYTLQTGAGWTSGLYLVNATERLSGADKVAQAWFVVRDDDRVAEVLFQSSVTTVLAYNSYGGRSLYNHNSAGGQRAYRVSFDRPTWNVINGDYSQPMTWEGSMARWLEAQGYDVSYVTNVDVHQQGAPLVTGHRAFLSVGHDEYWSDEEFSALEEARDAGTSLAFFSANTAYWRVRFEPSSDGEDSRVMVCYKEDFRRDPVLWAPTNRFRDPENGRPENGLLGVMYIGDTVDLYGGFDYIIDTPADRAFRHTGLVAGDRLPRLVGYEWDAVVDNGATPRGLLRLAHADPVPTDVAPGYTGPQVAHMTRYTARGGAEVFASGSIQWSWGLDSTGVPMPRESQALRQITANVLTDMGALPATPAPTLTIP